MVASRHTPTLLRILKLWRLYATLDFVWMTSDLKLFLSYLCSDLLLNLAAVIATFLLAERFQSIGAWTRDQIIFMLGYALVTTGVVDTFFSYNILFISRRLGRGQLDHTLIQPQPIWMALLTDGFAPFSGSASLVAGLVLLLAITHSLALAVTPVWLVVLLLNILASAAVLLAFSFLWGCLAFWAPRAAEEVSSSAVYLMTQLKGYPLDGLAPALLGSLVTVLPVGFVAWYPSRALLGLAPFSWELAITPLAALVLAGLAVLAFAKGLQHYERTGSQRYSTFGHRS